MRGLIRCHLARLTAACTLCALAAILFSTRSTALQPAVVGDEFVYWIGPAEGNFGDGRSWDLTIPPACGSIAIFREVPTDVLVHVDVDADIHGLSIQGGTETNFDLQGNTLTLAGACPANPSERVMVLSGLLNPKLPEACFSPDPLTVIGFGNGTVIANGDVRVGYGCNTLIELPGQSTKESVAGARLRLEDVQFVAGDVLINECVASACHSASILEVNKGATVTADSVFVYNFSGQLDVQGGSLEVGTLSNQGGCTISEGAEVVASQMDLRTGDLSIKGTGTTCVTNDLRMGAQVIAFGHCGGGPIPGSAYLEITDGGMLVCKSAVIGGQLEFSNCGPTEGNLLIHGTGSMLQVADSLIIGEWTPPPPFTTVGGRGTIFISDGGRLESPNTTILNSFPMASIPTNVAVEGSGSEWANAGLIDGGNLRVGVGGRIETQSLISGEIRFVIDSQSQSSQSEAPISVIDTAVLGGTLRLCWGPGVLPEVDDVFLLLTAGTVNGAFDVHDVPPGVEIVYGRNTVTAVVVAPQCLGDMVDSATLECPGDGMIDGADLAFLLGEWGIGESTADLVTSATFQPPPDGIVDGADLAVLLGAWGNCE